MFEGAFEKIFSIIKEEGGSEGGVVVQVIRCYTAHFFIVLADLLPILQVLLSLRFSVLTQ